MKHSTRLATHRQRRHAAGVTLLEVIVVIAVLGVLMSILLPAVQMARESARRMTCSSNLHQIGIAIGNYLDSQRVFPGRNLRRDLNGILFAKLDLELAERVNLAVLSCPSDPLAEASFGNQSYYLNDGATLESAGNGILGSGRLRQIKPADVTDGLSNTATVSERLPFDEYVRLDLDIRTLGLEERRRVFHRTSQAMPTIGQFAAECHARPGAVFPGWINTARYNHIVPPNSNNCVNGSNALLDQLAIPPQSLHGRGVELLMADGAVRFISQSIDREVWWGIGTRNGGEVVKH